MEKLFKKATWENLWRRMLASNLWHKAVLSLCVVLAVIAVFAAVYYWLLPRISYRELTNSVINEGSVVSATVVRGDETFELNNMQILAVISWLADYRSENKGISHADEWEGNSLDLVLDDGRDVRLFVEPSAIVFEGILGHYRLKVDYNELFYLINELYRG